MDEDMKSLSPEEAIAILSDMKIDIPVPKAAVTQRKRNVALDMAISALQPAEADVQKIQDLEQAEIQKAYELGKLDAMELQWIPCCERLPDNNRQVLVYARSVHFALAKYDEMREADGTYKMQWVTFDAWKPFYKIKEVIAWMPLPEPYREGKGDTNEPDKQTD